MGHRRTGEPPKSRQWREIVCQMGTFYGKEREVNAFACDTLRNVRDRFERIERDPGVREAFRFPTASQTATSKKGRGGRRVPPYAFTEHGAIMATNVLNSPRAVQTSIQVVRPSLPSY